MPLSRAAGRGGGRAGRGRVGGRAGGPPTLLDRFLEIFRLLDTTNWVTPKGDYRSVLSGLIGLSVLTILIVWLSVQFSTKAYMQTDASCTCLPLDEVRVNQQTYKIESFPEVYTRKVCEDHAEGQFCSADCLAESTTNFMNELCDPGSFGCQCLEGGKCDNEDLYSCRPDTNECGLATGSSLARGSNESVALFDGHRSGSNSVAVNFCVQEFKRKVRGILSLLGLPANSTVELTDVEMAHFRNSAVCVASWDACVLPVTPVQQLNIIGSTWGWGTLFILPLLMSINCFLKSKYHGIGAPDFDDNDSDREHLTNKQL